MNSHVQRLKLPEALLRFLSRKPGASLCKIYAEASRRSFYRLRSGRIALVAMVYPEPMPSEVERFCAVQKIYHDHGLRVPRIDRVLADQVVLQEDGGDLLLQKAWRQGEPDQRIRLLNECREILRKLAAIPSILAGARLDRARLDWEMDFFIKHFFSHYPAGGCGEKDLQEALAIMVEGIEAQAVFAHRDFHSRNLLVTGSSIMLVDFQDSLVAPRHYDLVSLAFDSYLALGRSREILFAGREWTEDDRRQLRLTALQRNIKALGTFAFQVHENKHLAYARYIPRTLRHILSHLDVLADPELQVLFRYFSSVTRNA